MTLVEFILARVAEDEAAATAALIAAPSYGSINDNAFAELLDLADNEGASEAAGKHAQLWAPARVLAECEAKRAIIDQHADYHSCGAMDRNPSEDDNCLTVRFLALPYVEHPDYDEAWRP